jgi:hypothetical protein
MFGFSPVKWIMSLLAPPPIASTDELMGEAEAEIERIEFDELPEAVNRARRALLWQHEQRAKGIGVAYGLGWGGKDPTTPHPFEYDPKTKTWKCDCSGAIAHQEGKPRNLPGYGYIWTDGLVRDGKLAVKGDLGYEVPRAEVQVGDLLVQKSVDTDGDGDRDIVGHVGRVTAVDAPFVSLTKSVTVIEVASRPKPGGYKEGRSGATWEKRGIVFRFRR